MDAILITRVEDVIVVLPIRVLPAVIRTRVALMAVLQQILVEDVKVVKEIHVPVQHVRQLRVVLTDVQVIARRQVVAHRFVQVVSRLQHVPMVVILHLYRKTKHVIL